MDLVFVETSIFTKQINELLSDEEYKELQQHLVETPTAGPVIKDTGGCRKVRWAMQNNGGKSGGLRVIYYWIKDDHQIYMLLAYEKSSQDSLSDKQKKTLKGIVRAELQSKENEDG